METKNVKILEQKFALAIGVLMKMEQGLNVIDRKGKDDTVWKVCYMKTIIADFYDDLVRINEGKTKKPTL